MTSRTAILLITLCAAICLAFTGCEAIKTARDNKAFTRIISDSALSERTYKNLKISHPCITSDSSFRLIPGKQFTVHDTSSMTDTVVVKDTMYITKIMHDVKTIHSVDTLKIKVKDLTDVQMITNDYNKSAGQVSLLTTQLSAANSKANSWFCWFIGSLVGWAITSFLLVYFKI